MMNEWFSTEIHEKTRSVFKMEVLNSLQYLNHIEVEFFER